MVKKISNKKLKSKKIKIKAKKRILKKPILKIKDLKGKPIGKVAHYFSEIKVAVIDVLSPLKNGDTVRIVGGQETDFEQKINSIQIDHKEVKSAKKGNSIGLKVDEKVREGYMLYKA